MLLAPTHKIQMGPFNIIFCMGLFNIIFNNLSNALH